MLQGTILRVHVSIRKDLTVSYVGSDYSVFGNKAVHATWKINPLCLEISAEDMHIGLYT